MRVITATRLPGGTRCPAPTWGDFGLTEADLAWQDRGNCRGTGADSFFPDKGMSGHTQAAEAKAACAGCPVRGQCLDYALTHRVPFGIWGGLTAFERRALLARRTTGRRTRRLDVQVGRLTRAGLTADQIATELGVTARTVTRARARLRDHSEAA
jgi:transcription factor WhiB/Homeodomain-like domain-containing protein